MHVIDALGRRKVSGGTSVLAYMGNNESGASWRVQDGNFQIWNVTQSGWQTIYFTGAAGLEQIVLGGVDTSASTGTGYMEPDRAGDSFSVSEGNFRLWNLTQSIWQTPFIVDRMGAPQIAVGTGDAPASLGGGCGVRTVIGDYTALSTDCIILASATLAAITVSLPVAATALDKEYTIKKIDSSVNAVTIDPDGAETIDGAATKVISSQWSAAHIVSNGTGWFIV